MANHSMFVLCDYLHRIYNNHRKFTTVQKIVSLFAILSILCLISGYFRSVAVLYTLSLSITIYIFERSEFIEISAYSEYIQFFIELLIQTWSLFQPLFNELKNIEWRSENDNNDERDEENEDDKQDAYSVDTPQSEHSNGVVQLSVEQKLNGEVELFINLILRDFIQSWYKIIGSSPDILDECSDLLHALSSILTTQIAKLSNEKILKKIIIHFCHHIQSVQLSRSLYSSRSKTKRRFYNPPMGSINLSYQPRRLSSVEEAFESSFDVHPALKNDESEMNYVQGILNVLITKLLTDSFSKCGGANTLLTEILTHNMIIPVFHLLSHPDFVYDSLIRILSDESPVIVDNVNTFDHDSVLHSAEPLTLPTNPDESDGIESLPASLENSDTFSSLQNSVDSEVFLAGEMADKFPCGNVIFDKCDRYSSIPSETSAQGDSELLFRISLDSEEKTLDQLFGQSSASETLKSSSRSVPERICSIPFETECRNADGLLLSPEKSPQSIKHSISSDADTNCLEKTNLRLKRYLSDSSSSSRPPDASDYLSDTSHEDGDCFPNLDILPEKKGFFIDPEDDDLSENPPEEDYVDSPGLDDSEQLFIFQDVHITGTETAKESRSSSKYTLYVVEVNA